MAKNYLKYLVSAVLMFFLTSPAFVFALETEYPNIPGAPTITDKSGIASYIAYFFTLAIIAAGILAVIFLTIGGIRLIMSAGSPAGRTEALDIIKGAILGLLLLMTAYLILRTINPDFIKPNLTPLPAGDGIFYINGDDRLPAPMSESNTRNIPEGYDQLLYACSSGPSLFVWKFPQKNFEGIEGAHTEAIDCGATVGVTDAGSFRLAFETTGLYYCMGECSESGTICSGFMSDANTASGQLPQPFKDTVKLKSILFVNDLSSGAHYSAIFHDVDDPTGAGNCSTIYNVPEKSILKKRVCFEINSDPTSSVTVFAWNYQTPETSGTGVDFYSEPWGQLIEARAGKYSLKKDEIKNYFVGQAKEFKFNYAGVNRPAQYKTLYQTFQQHPGSIYMQGNYVVVLRQKEKDQNQQNQNQNEEDKIPFCQVFFNKVFNIKEVEFIIGGISIEKIEVIPVK